MGIYQLTGTVELVETIGGRIRALMAQLDPPQTQRDLALSVGMTPDALSRALSGSRGFGISELIDIAARLRTSVHWLATGESDPFEVRVAARHTFDHMTKTHAGPDWTTARPTFENIALLYDQVRPPGVNPVSGSRGIKGMSAAAVRDTLTTSYGRDFVRTFASAVEETLAVDVIRIDGAGDGYSMSVGSQDVVVISNTSNWFFQNWTLAHELGHIADSTLSPLTDETSPAAPDDERAANAFAAELLMPLDEMRAIDWRNITLPRVANLIWDLGVSTSALSKRLKALQLGRPELDTALSASTQRFLRANNEPRASRASDAISERMQAATTRRFPPHLVNEHRAAVEAGVLRAASLAWMLDDDEGNVAEQLAPPTTPSGSLDDLARRLGTDI